MGFFKRKEKSDKAGLEVLQIQGEDIITKLAEAHLPWGLGTATGWELDQTTGMITWSFPDGRSATAPAQIIGSYNQITSSWLWAWANKSIVPALSRDSLLIKEWAEQNDQPALAQQRIEADEETADKLSAIAVRLTRATGFYRAGGAGTLQIVTFGPVTLTSAAGETTTFEVKVG